MSGSTTHLDLLSAGQAQKEVTANELFNAASPSMLGAYRALTSGGLTWGYYGGSFGKEDKTIVTVANGTVSLTASATNYVEMNPTTGAVTANTTGWTSGYVHLYTVTTSASTVSSYVDYRTSFFLPAATAVTEDDLIAYLVALGD